MCPDEEDAPLPRGSPIGVDSTAALYFRLGGDSGGRSKNPAFSTPNYFSHSIMTRRNSQSLQPQHCNKEMQWS